MLHYGLFAAASLAFLLPWQFSQFVLVTQSFTLLMLHSFQLIPSTKLTGIFLSIAAALFGNILLQFGNSLLFFSLLPSSILSCLVSVDHFPPTLSIWLIIQIVIKTTKFFIPWKTCRIVWHCASIYVHLLLSSFCSIRCWRWFLLSC